MPSYATLVRDFHSLVFRVAFGVLRDRAAAEDVTQDVFLSFLVDPGPLERASSIRAFVCRVALNRALDARKASQRRAVRESAFAERSGEMNPIEEVFRRELREKVHELPDIHRAAVDLHYFQGLTIEETAEVLDVPRGTASRRISDALATLRKWLSAAAFVALLAKLESELSKVEAADVPAGLEGRLLKLKGPAASSGAKGKTAKAAVALAVAILFAVYTGQWIETHDPRWTGGPSSAMPIVAAAPRSVSSEEEISVADATTTDAAAAALPVPAAEPVAATAETETVLEGFLFRTPEGLCLAEEIVPSPGEGFHTGEVRPAGRVWLLSGGGLDSWPAADTANFTPFLCDGAPSSSAPRARVRLRARIPSGEAPLPQIAAERISAPHMVFGKFELKAEDLTVDGASSLQLEAPDRVIQFKDVTIDFGIAQATADFAGDVENLNKDATVDASKSLEAALAGQLEDNNQQKIWMALQRNQETHPVAATVLEVLDVELLSDAWLEAWRNMFVEASAILANAAGSPEELAASAARLGDAIRRARLARAGQSPTTWRVRMEQKFSADARSALAEKGFESLLPQGPGEAQLREAFLSAVGPEAFEAIVKANWGDDALGATVRLYPVPRSRNDDIEIALEGKLADPVDPGYSVADLAAMKTDAFLDAQKQARDWDKGQEMTPKG